MDRAKTIEEIVHEIKRQTRRGTSLGPTKTQRFYLNDHFCVTFNSPSNPFSSAVYNLRHWDMAGHMTNNIVISEKLQSPHRLILRRVRLTFWHNQKEWVSRRTVQEIRLTGKEKDWAVGDADYPVYRPERQEVIDERVYPTVTDVELRKLTNALEQLVSEGTWEETF